MPTYEYRCPGGHEFEKFYRSISAGVGEVACPTCGLVAVRQMSGGAGLMFKGSGFYLTDYGKNAHATKGTPPQPGGESSSGGDGKAGEESKGDKGDGGKGATDSSSASAAKSEKGAKGVEGSGKPAAKPPKSE